MYTWKRYAVFAASLLAAACTGEIDQGTRGPGSGPGPVGGGDTGSGIDVDGDGIIDGYDTNGDGLIDAVPNSDGSLDPVTPDEVVPSTQVPAETCTPGVPGTSQLRRLTKVEYDNTIRDLVGLDTVTDPPSALLAPDTVGSVDQRAWDGYRAAGVSVSERIMADANAKAAALTCTTADDACAAQFIADFGKRAFRRPLTQAETDKFTAMYTNRATLTANGTFDEAALLILESFLVSPNFLTKAEMTETAEGSYFALSGYEVATRLSYMLWGTMPDTALFTAAESGSLGTKEGILAEANRMLTDPKARQRVAAFHDVYAHMGQGGRYTEAYTRDTTKYPLYNDSFQPMLLQEEQRFYDYITFDMGGTFQDLMTSPVGFVNASTAPIYGLDASAYGADLTQVSLDPAVRPGALTRLGFLSAYSAFDRTSPILRGAFVQKEVLCTDVGVPDPAALSTPVPSDPNLVTNRERVDAQTAGSTCATCHHTLINPSGFPFESFDAVGGIQTTDNTQGVAVDTVSDVPMDGAVVNVTGAADLANALASSPQAQRCYARKWAEFAYQRSPNSVDACTVNDMATKLNAGGYTVLQLVADLTQADSFRLRALETEVAQ